MSEIVIKITGMSCGHCSASVEKALKALSAVSSAQVSLNPGEARITPVDGANVEALRKEACAAVRGIGFEAN